MTEPDGGPVYVLPEAAPLDARSAAGLALNTALDAQLAAQPNAMVALDPGKLADAVLAVVGDYPQIPRWLDGEPRSIGGGSRPGSADVDATITVDVPLNHGDTVDPDHLHFAIEGEIDTGDAVRPYYGHARVPVDDAEQWALAVLAACRRARADAG